jgi:hypothetical protein
VCVYENQVERVCTVCSDTYSGNRMYNVHEHVLARVQALGVGLFVTCSCSYSGYVATHTFLFRAHSHNGVLPHRVLGCSKKCSTFPVSQSTMQQFNCNLSFVARMVVIAAPWDEVAWHGIVDIGDFNVSCHGISIMCR